MSSAKLPSISAGSIHRAEEADPNGRRCLVENCPPERAVQLTHVVRRELTNDSELMTVLEQNWGMRYGTLNLDTRRNLLFLGASLRQMFMDGKWGLIPEESVLDRYMTRHGRPITGYGFNSTSEPTYKYTFCAIRDMEGTGITVQNEHPPKDERSFTVHVYPFTELPMLTSHLDPKFAVIHFIRVAVRHKDLSDHAYQQLVARYPVILKIMRLYQAWLSIPPILGPGSEDSESNSSRHSDELDIADSDGDSVRTVPRRLAFPVQEKPSSRKRPHQENPSSDALSKKKLRQAQIDTTAGHSGWTKEAVAQWVGNVSSASSAPSHVESNEEETKEPPPN